MKNHMKRLAALALAAVLILGAVPAQAAEEDALTRGEAANILLEAGFKYTPELEFSDILKGYPGGNLDLDGPVTLAQAMVMLERAFGGLPAPVGDSARMAYPAGALTDVPAWATGELETVLNAGIVAGTGDEPITQGELDALIRRVYALKGTDVRDDFYTAANKQWLDNSDLPAGLSLNGPFYGLGLTVNRQIAQLIKDIHAKPQTPGTAEAKIKALYDCVLDAEGREQAGVAPIQKYLDAIENAGTLDELMAADLQMRREIGLSTLLGFGLTTDMADSDRHIVAFSAFGTNMGKDFYANGTQAQVDAYLTYLTTLFTLSGLSEEEARALATTVYETEKPLALAALDPQEYADVDKIYNLYTMKELQALFPQVDLETVYAATGLQPADKLLVTDVGYLEAAAKLFDDAHLDELKTVARLWLLVSVGSTLNRGFMDASIDFTLAYYGVDARQSDEELAAQMVQGLLADYLGRAYAEAYFSEEAKADVEAMIRDFIAIYKQRIQALEWMSPATKAKAIAKLDAMQIKVGYPDSWETYLDSAQIKSPAEGGSLFSNTISIQKAALADSISRQNERVDKSEWIMHPFTVNACYSATSNDITFPAAILQAPLYDVNASREENLGGIGHVIAHEITHAFDNNGAKFDEKGNAVDWWTEADYAAFREKCQAVIAWYDGQEAYPGVTCNGTLTLSENVADLGSIQCVLAAARQQGDPDYDKLFRAVANTWASTTSRQMRENLAVTDTHAPDKLRCNRVLQTADEFYETYGIHPGDGMWTDPESRISIW